MNKNWSIKMLTEAGVMIALAFILGKIRLFEMPQGGAITVGQMIPLIIFSMRYGLLPGLFVCGLFGVVEMIFDWAIFHPIQALLDYPIAYMSLGLCGIFSNQFKKTGSIKPVICGTFLGVFVRFLCHVLSGVIFFSSYAPEGQNPIIYSLTYNGSYLFVESMLSIFIIFLLRNFIRKDLRRL